MVNACIVFKSVMAPVSRCSVIRPQKCIFCGRKSNSRGCTYLDMDLLGKSALHTKKGVFYNGLSRKDLKIRGIMARLLYSFPDLLSPDFEGDSIGHPNIFDVYWTKPEGNLRSITRDYPNQ